METLVAGLDLGSTGIKMLVLDSEGHEVALRTSATPWQEETGGAIVLTQEALLDTVHGLLAQVAEDLAAAPATAGSTIAVLSVTGMGESGFLIDPDDQVIAPAFAWFDRSGQAVVDALPDQLRADFAGRTGLPWGVQVSAAKIAHLRSLGMPVAGTRWLSLPEFVVHALGGRAVAERSLAARTGLLCLETGRPWPELVTYLGVGPQIIPELVDAGTVVGRADPARVPRALADARLTIAGHDHLVSSLSGMSEDAATASEARYHVSLGTAEVLLRVIDTPLTFEARSRLGAYLINCVPHIVPGRWVIVAGVKTGLLMRRALAMLGISDEQARLALDRAVLDLPPATGAGESLVVAGARNDDGELTLKIGTDDISPATLMRAVLEHGNAEIARLIEAMDAELPPATSALLTGGWTSWASVREARSRVLPNLEVSHRSQDTAYGAAISALALRDAAHT